jgi:hypothetical protein
VLLELLPLTLALAGPSMERVFAVLVIHQCMDSSTE